MFVPTFRDDALEQLAIVDAMREGDVEPTRVVQNALDVLAQLIVACVASDEPEWTAAELFDFVRRAYPYHTLTRVGVRRDAGDARRQISVGRRRRARRAHLRGTA